MASSLETGEAEALVEETTTEVTKPAAKTTRTKRVAIERGERYLSDQALPTAHFSTGMGPSSWDSHAGTLIIEMLDAVLYTAELRAPELDGPAVRLLTWNVASLRSSLKKVCFSHSAMQTGIMTRHIMNWPSF